MGGNYIMETKNINEIRKKYFQDLERIINNLKAERLDKINETDPGDLEKLIKLQNISDDLLIIEKEKSKYLTGHSWKYII